jgi:3',5'-cyclic AMP phosphodiesterase CpdA
VGSTPTSFRQNVSGARVRFLHTSDWHIGLKAAHAGAAGPRLRAERLAAARRIAAIAREQAVEFVLIAGDIFDASAPAPAEIRETAALLNAFPAPVYLIPGNHDPDVPGGPWQHAAWREAANVHLLLEAEPVALAGGTLYPCPLRSRWHGGDPLAWIPSRQPEDGIRIGLAHGGLKAFGGPIAEQAAVECDLDYLALGDWHSMNEGNRQAYCGTPETDAFGQRDSGFVLIVEIAAASAPPVITRQRSGRLTWRKQAVSLAAAGDAARLRAELEPGAGGEVVLDLEVSGALNPGDERELDAIEALLRERYFHGRLTRGRLWPAGAEAALPAGLLSLADARLREQAEAGDEVAARALLELRRLALEAGL